MLQSSSRQGRHISHEARVALFDAFQRQGKEGAELLELDP